MLTTDYVIDETLTTLRSRLGLAVAEAWWEMVTASRRLRIEAIDPPRAERARFLFFRHKEQDFSFTDCSSFALMRELRLRHVLTLDRHFRHMGFELVPGN